MEGYVVFVISMRREKSVRISGDMIKRSCTLFDFFQRELVPSSEEFRGPLRVDWYTKSRGCYYCFREGCHESTVYITQNLFYHKNGSFQVYCILYIS